MKTKPISATLLAIMLVSHGASWAGCVANDRGNPHAEQPKYNRTDMIADRTDNPWWDRFWRGRDDNERAYCPTNNHEASCPYTWTLTRSKSTTWGIGGGVDAGANTNNWFKKAEGSLAAAFNATWQKTTTSANAYAFQVTHARGTYAEPALVQKRRWQSGYFRGGWVENEGGSANDAKPYCYDYNDNVRFGWWGSHSKYEPIFRTVDIYR